MKKSRLVTIALAAGLALATSACSVGVPLVIGAAATAAVVDRVDPSLGVAKEEKALNDKIVAFLAPYAEKAVDVFFHNPYAAKSYPDFAGSDKGGVR